MSGHMRLEYTISSEGEHHCLNVRVETVVWRIPDVWSHTARVYYL